VLITRWQILRANPLDKIENSLPFKYTIAAGRIAIVNHILSNDESGRYYEKRHPARLKMLGGAVSAQ